MCFGQLKTYLGIAQAIATVVALGFGTWWTWWLFIRTRQKYPKVRLSHSFFQCPINRNWTLLRVSLKVDNQGSVLIMPGNVETRLLQLKPWPPEVGRAIKQSARLRTIPNEVFDHYHLLKENQADFKWPYISNRIVAPQRVEIEPNESDEFHFDFIINRLWRVISVYSHVENRRKRGKKLGWPITSVVELTGEGTNAR